jgi:hypothetical protein
MLNNGDKPQQVAQLLRFGAALKCGSTVNVQWCWHMHPWPGFPIKRLQRLLLQMLSAIRCCIATAVLHSHATNGAFGFSRRELHSDVVWCSTPQQDAYSV